MAARAHDVAVLALSGTSAKFNFPESVSLLPLPNSSSAIDIRAAAAKATSADLTFSSSHNGNNAHQCPCFNFSMLGLEGIPDSNSNDESQTMFFDEEALYNMPALLDSMAEGLLLTPPSIKTPMDWDDLASQIDLTLWTN
uniref:Dehydration-responsive element-binding protein 1C n=2 Tax=Cajanus cajan TaxID=3821 RepID=A0A151TNM0_CAJCA|nr:Dehydration-responsive element-binding protein 1C [Cajanus cajan]